MRNYLVVLMTKQMEDRLSAGQKRSMKHALLSSHYQYDTAAIHLQPEKNRLFCISTENRSNRSHNSSRLSTKKGNYQNILPLRYLCLCDLRSAVDPHTLRRSTLYVSDI